jgi:hypothetical protein
MAAESFLSSWNYDESRISLARKRLKWSDEAIIVETHRHQMVAASGREVATFS